MSLLSSNTGTGKHYITKGWRTKKDRRLEPLSVDSSSCVREMFWTCHRDSLNLIFYIQNQQQPLIMQTNAESETKANFDVSIKNRFTEICGATEYVVDEISNNEFSYSFICHHIFFSNSLLAVNMNISNAMIKCRIGHNRRPPAAICCFGFMANFNSSVVIIECFGQRFLQHC